MQLSELDKFSEYGIVQFILCATTEKLKSLVCNGVCALITTQ